MDEAGAAYRRRRTTSWRARRLTRDPGRAPEPRAGAPAAGPGHRKDRAAGRRDRPVRRLQAADQHRVPRRHAQAGVRSDLAPLRPELPVRQGRQDRPAHLDLPEEQHGRSGRLLPAGEQPARAAGHGRQHHPGLPEHRGQAQGIPGDDGQDLLPGQRRRQERRQYAQDHPQVARRGGRREAQPGDRARQPGSDQAGHPPGGAAGRRRAGSHARRRDPRDQAQPPDGPRHRLAGQRRLRAAAGGRPAAR